MKGPKLDPPGRTAFDFKGVHFLTSFKHVSFAEGSKTGPSKYVLRPRRGLGQASPSLDAPRLQALEIRQLFHQQNRKGKSVMIKTAGTVEYMGLVLGSFLAPQTDMIFGDGVGASLVRGPYCQLGVGLCDVDAFRAAEEGAWVGSKPDLQGGTGCNLTRTKRGSGLETI